MPLKFSKRTPTITMVIQEINNFKIKIYTQTHHITPFSETVFDNDNDNDNDDSLREHVP